MFNTRKEILFTVLAGFFVTNAIVGELIGGKLIQLGPFTMSIGIIPWPVVFLTTDIINEYFGKNGVRRLTLMTAALIAYTFILLLAGMNVPASVISPVKDEQFHGVFGQSMWIIVGSITAFLASQLVDVLVFWLIRSHTGKRMIWLRATGSTVISQLIDTFIVTGIAFWLPGKLSFGDYINTAFTGYSAKLIIAIALTPLIYLGHAIVHSYLGREKSDELATESSEASIR
jgi:queuosine precursor transporter